MDYLQTELSNLISSLGEDNFNRLIKEFNKEYYSTNDVRIVNGPYDGGIDLEIYKDDQEIKRNIQITVQKSKLESKIKADLGKAKLNASKYAYQKNLDFYCAVAISGSQKRIWKRMAQVDFGIELKIYDNSSLAELSETFISIKNTVFEIFGVQKNPELIKVDKHTKVLYDMFAIGKDTGELKRQFLHSLIVTFIFENANCTEADIFNGLKNSINNNVQSELIIKSQLDSLRTKGIIINGPKKNQLDLSFEKRNEINEILNTSLAQESLLKSDLENCLKSYNLAEHVKTIVQFIYKSFQENYNADLEELSRNSSHQTNAIKKIYSDLIKFITTNVNSTSSSSILARKILEICTKNEYLSKISASILFTKLFQSNKLETYLSRKKQFLFLDTQILLRIICLGNIQKDIPDISMKSVSDFMNTVKKYKSTIFLQTSHDYIHELTIQIQDALKLERFFLLPIIREMGSHTNNVIYNYYRTLLNNNLYDKDLTIHDFVSEILDSELPSFNSPEFLKIVSNKIENIFEFLDISIIYLNYDEDYPFIKREYEISLGEKLKSARARENDVKTIMYLSDAKLHIDDSIGMPDEPFLITWDNSFYGARKKVLERFSKRGYWYIYTPSKFADRISLQNFQLNPTSINNNIVSLTESSFNTSSKTSFIDLLSGIFTKEDLSDLDIAHKLIRLEEQIKPTKEEVITENVIEESSPLIKILLELRAHYSKNENKFGMDKLVSTLENNSNANLIYEIISSNVESWNQMKKIKTDLFTRIDKLMEE
jgi:hypothetical protein